MPFEQWEELIKLFTAAGLGAAIGLERQVHGRPAGLRTNILVCVASCLLIMVSRSGALEGLEPNSGVTINFDPARMAAGIVTGIGFLGAGAILRIRESLIRGLTTAAGIWFVAAVGISVGVGAYVLAVTSTLLGLVVLIGLNRVDRKLETAAYRTITLRIEKDRRVDAERQIAEVLNAKRIHVHQRSYEIGRDAPLDRVVYSLRVFGRVDEQPIIEQVFAVPGVVEFHWG